MTNVKQVLSYLRSISPKQATNSDIRANTGVKPHAQVYQITRRLLDEGVVDGRQIGHEWCYWFKIPGPAREDSATDAVRPRAAGSPHSAVLSAAEFEVLAREVMGKHFGTSLQPGSIPGVRKKFDMVSGDYSVVGDAKYYTLVQGKRLPPAKFSVIAEHAWLLEKTSADHQFLVFGNERRVPLWWLEKYGNLLSGTEFYFLTDDGKLENLT